jgi:hypothetical protein
MVIFKFKQFHLENHCETNIILKLLVKIDIVYISCAIKTLYQRYSWEILTNIYFNTDESDIEFKIRVDYFLLNEWTEIKPTWRMLHLDFFHNNHTCFDVICATCIIHVMMSFSMYHKKIKIISSKRLCSVVKIKHYSSKHLFIWVVSEISPYLKWRTKVRKATLVGNPWSIWFCRCFVYFAIHIYAVCTGYGPVIPSHCLSTD